MNAPRSNASAWGQAGRDAAQSFYQIAETTRKYSPKFGDIEKAGIQTRSYEKQAAINAERNVRNAEINAASTVEKANIEVDRFKAEQGARKTMRKAGMVAAASGAIALGLMPEDEPIKQDFQSEYDYLDQQDAKAAEKRAEILSQSDSALPDTPSAGSNTGGSSSNNTTTGNAGKDSTAPANTGAYKGDNKGLRLMQTLTSKGYSPVSAAAIAGNAMHESDNFRAYEEYAPNVYGTKGVGFLQWTGSRRNEFENWAASQNLRPDSFEASSRYITHEMEGGRHWSPGMNTERFKGITDLDSATRAYADYYLRPGIKHTDRRLQNARTLLQQWENR